MRRFTASILGAVVLLLTGCASPADWSTELTPAWTLETTLMSEPVIAGDVVLAYAMIEGGNEALFAWDAATGEELWNHPALPGRSPRGTSHDVATIETADGWRVAILAPRHSTHESNDWSRFMILDVSTGTRVDDRLRQTWLWGLRPSSCADQTTFCAYGTQKADYDANGRELNDKLFQYDSQSGSLVEADYDDAPFHNGGTPVSELLSVTAEHELQYGADGKVHWTRAYKDVFGVGASITGGWSWSDGERSDLPLIGVGSLSVERDLTQPFDAAEALDTSRTVALDRDDGKTLWLIDGAEPCANTGWEMEIVDETVVLCRYLSGTISWHWDGSTATDIEYHDVEVEVIGADAESGEILWTTALGDHRSNYASPGEGEHAFVTDGGLIRVVDGTAQHVDLRTGELHPYPDDAVLLCAAEREEVDLISFWKDPTYLAAPTHTLCNPDGTALDGRAPTPATLVEAGFQPDETAAIYMGKMLTVFAPRP